MDVSVDRSRNIVVLRVSGSLDALTAGELSDRFSALIDGGEARLVADLAGLDYTSSAGLRTLLGALKQARGAGGDLRLAAVQGPVKKVLDLSGFSGIMKLFSDVESAIDSYSE